MYVAQRLPERHEFLLAQRAQARPIVRLLGAIGENRAGFGFAVLARHG